MRRPPSACQRSWKSALPRCRNPVLPRLGARHHRRGRRGTRAVRSARWASAGSPVGLNSSPSGTNSNSRSESSSASRVSETVWLTGCAAASFAHCRAGLAGDPSRQLPVRAGCCVWPRRSTPARARRRQRIRRGGRPLNARSVRRRTIPSRRRAAPVAVDHAAPVRRARQGWQRSSCRRCIAKAIRHVTLQRFSRTSPGAALRAPPRPAS